MARNTGRRSTSSTASKSSSKPIHSQASSSNSLSKQANPSAVQSAAPVAVPASQPGFFSGVMQTAAGVAIGHSIGHAITGTAGALFGSGNSSTLPSESATNSSSFRNQENTNPLNCDPHLKSFMDCMDKNYQDVSACQLYLDMLKTCRGQPTSTATSNTSTTSSW